MLVKCYEEELAINQNHKWLTFDAGQSNIARYQAVEAAAQPRLKRLARLIRKVVGVPCVSISMVPESSVILMAGVGVPYRRAVPEVRSFTMECIRAGRTCSIRDISEHPEFAIHPLAIEAPHVRSWASALIASVDQPAIGVINIWDISPRDFTPDELELIEGFANVAAIELGLLQTASQVKDREILLQDIFDNAAVGVSVFGEGNQRIAVNKYFCQLLKYDHEDIVSIPFPGLVHADDKEETRLKRKSLISGEYSRYQHEYRLLCRDGAPIWVRESCSKMTGNSNSAAYLVSIYENISERRNSDLARDILLGEINHRVKNTLAIVQGIAKQLLKSAPAPEEFSAAFESRIQALAQSHDLLTETSWNPIDFKQMVDSLFGGQWANYRQQIRMSLPEVQLNAQTAIMLNLLLNELATNAVKHGALQTAAGLIDVRAVKFDENGLTWINLIWREYAGRKIERASRVGLGLYLIDRAPRLGLGGKGKFEFRDDGILWEVSFPVYPSQKPFDCSAATDSQRVN